MNAKLGLAGLRNTVNDDDDARDCSPKSLPKRPLEVVAEVDGHGVNEDSQPTVQVDGDSASTGSNNEPKRQRTAEPELCSPDGECDARSEQNSSEGADGCGHGHSQRACPYLLIRNGGG